MGRFSRPPPDDDNRFFSQDDFDPFRAADGFKHIGDPAKHIDPYLLPPEFGGIDTSFHGTDSPDLNSTLPEHLRANNRRQYRESVDQPEPPTLLDRCGFDLGTLTPYWRREYEKKELGKDRPPPGSVPDNDNKYVSLLDHFRPGWHNIPRGSYDDEEVRRLFEEQDKREAPKWRSIAEEEKAYWATQDWLPARVQGQFQHFLTRSLEKKTLSLNPEHRQPLFRDIEILLVNGGEQGEGQCFKLIWGYCDGKYRPRPEIRPDLAIAAEAYALNKTDENIHRFFGLVGELAGVMGYEGTSPWTEHHDLQYAEYRRRQKRRDGTAGL